MRREMDIFWAFEGDLKCAKVFLRDVKPIRKVVQKSKRYCKKKDRSLESFYWIFNLAFKHAQGGPEESQFDSVQTVTDKDTPGAV